MDRAVAALIFVALFAVSRAGTDLEVGSLGDRKDKNFERTLQQDFRGLG